MSPRLSPRLVEGCDPWGLITILPSCMLASPGGGRGGVRGGVQKTSLLPLPPPPSLKYRAVVRWHCAGARAVSTSILYTRHLGWQGMGNFPFVVSRVTIGPSGGSQRCTVGGWGAGAWIGLAHEQMRKYAVLINSHNWKRSSRSARPTDRSHIQICKMIPNQWFLGYGHK